MNILFIIEVEILVFINWLYRSSSIFVDYWV